IRAMTGTGRRRNASQQRCTRVMNSRALVWSSPASSPISAPPTKARSPAPLTTRSRNRGSAPSAVTASMISPISARWSECSLAALAEVLDHVPLLIPDGLGTNRVDTIGNLLSCPGIGLIFFVPGVNETLRINGRASVTTDPVLLEPLAVNGKVPRSGILITAEEIYFHCGKALIRSDLWNPEKHIARAQWPSLGRIIAEQIGTDPVEGEQMTAESYRTRLY